MYLAINVIKEGVIPNSDFNKVEVVDFMEPNTAFDDDIEYEDAERGDDNQSKKCKIHHKIVKI